MTKTMRMITLALPLFLGACAVFSTPGKVTSSDATTEAGGVYGKVIQNPSGVGCPSVVGQGAQTMGSMSASCEDNGATQRVELTAPDPNPALTTAYKGISDMTTQLLNFAQSLVASAVGAGAGIPKIPGVPAPAPAPAPTSAPRALGPTAAQCQAIGRTLLVTSAGAVCQ